MNEHETFVIVGAGLAGAKAAQTLREEGFTGRIQLVGAETERPYERPPLSKAYLTGAAERDTAYVHPAAWYDEQDVELITGNAARSLDVAAHEVTLDGGERLRYDRLLLTTGASPRRLPVPGADLDGVHYLRRIQDADRLRAALTGGGRRVVVIGGGWIGLETAAAARGHGNEVTIVEPQPTPLRAALGEELGQMFADLHRDNGVDLRTGTGVRELAGHDGRVTAVVTDGGERLPADLVIVGVGVRPDTELAESAGLEVDDGIVVDEALRTSAPDIYAAGDVANAYHPLLGRRLRVEHWANALNGGPAAARSMLGRHVVYDRVPYFYTDQYDLGMEYSGHAGPGGYDRLVYRGDRRGRRFIAFWLSGGRVVAGMNVNMWDVTGDIQALIRSAAPVDPQRLANTDVPLVDLLPARMREEESRPSGD
ncbi:NAD(P)/FAD-dependent oxidoreductase [Thermomonospora amylolytica]|uniref:NAD(P)/FAD-dependent oxidoreductase n=1 Tax=Thermomonospora amylolytica TaxID=1411117 RepID=UPI000E6C11A4|nr:FAD-dependent oxidoreductase [Thermomonospora amylolytica]